MSFSQMLEILKKTEKGNIVFIRVGTFYIAVGEDAVLMHKKLDLKCTCFKTNICKVGFPILSLDRYGNKDRHTSIARCMLKIDNESIVQICGYDNVADFMYRNLQIGDRIVCEGYLDSERIIISNWG